MTDAKRIKAEIFDNCRNAVYDTKVFGLEIKN